MVSELLPPSPQISHYNSQEWKRFLTSLLCFSYQRKNPQGDRTSSWNAWTCNWRGKKSCVGNTQTKNVMFHVFFIINLLQSWDGNNAFYYTTKAVWGPITKINQSDRSIAGPIFSKYWTGYSPEWSCVVIGFQLKIKMADDTSFCQTLFLVLALKQARESCHIIQWGKPASVECLTPIFPKTTWCSLASTKILSAYKSASLSHQRQMSDALSGKKSQQLEGPAI